MTESPSGVLINTLFNQAINEAAEVAMRQGLSAQDAYAGRKEFISECFGALAKPGSKPCWAMFRDQLRSYGVRGSTIDEIFELNHFAPSYQQFAASLLPCQHRRALH